MAFLILKKKEVLSMEESTKFEELVERFHAKISMIPEDCQTAIMYWHLARRVQESRIAAENQIRQVMAVGEKVFWSEGIPDEFKATMLIGMGEYYKEPKDKEDASKKKSSFRYFEALRKQEDTFARTCEKEFKQSKWYNQVALAAAEGIGLGPMLAGSLLWTIGSAKRFTSFGKIVAYAGLSVTDKGKAPKRATGQRITWNPELRTTLYKLTEGWNKMPECSWRVKWDEQKAEYEHNRPEILQEMSEKGKPCGKGHIHNMARRKIQREFMRNLYWLWIEFENKEA